MTEHRFTVNSRKFDGSLSRSWEAKLIGRSPSSILLEGFFDKEVTHAALGLIEKGTRSVETFYLDLWYNWFAFYNASDTFRNYYINISMPPKVSIDVIDYIDLDIDFVVWPDGSVEELDVDEFQINVDRLSYPSEVVERVRKLKEQIKNSPYEFINPVTTEV